MKNQEALLYGLIGLLLGGFITYLVTNTKNVEVAPHMNQMMDSQTNMMGTHGESMSMEDMNRVLEGKTQDDFDRAFLEMMIDHHQGAIDMANVAKAQAKHTEIKQMADEIITAQTSEITQMRKWYTEWGY